MSEVDVKVVEKVYGSILDLYTDFPEKDQEADVIALGVLMGTNTVIIGPPGTAKSMMIDRLCEALNAKYFKYLLTKYTEPEEIFGNIDVKRFRENGEYVYNTSGKLPEAEIAFLDEIFKGSSAILNTLLMIINERQFHDGVQIRKVPLFALFGASNEVPDDETLNALYDRFLFRYFTDYVPIDKADELLESAWKLEFNGSNVQQIPFDVIKLCKNLIPTVNVSSVIGTLRDIFYEFYNKTERHISDRRKYWTLKAVAMRALTQGRDVAYPEDCDVIKYTIPEVPEDMEVVMKIIEDYVDKSAGEKRKLRELKEMLIKWMKEVKEDYNDSRMEEYIRVSRVVGRTLKEVQNARGTKEYEEVSDLLSKYNELLSNAILDFSLSEKSKDDEEGDEIDPGSR